MGANQLLVFNMYDAPSPLHKANRFATVDDVSEQIFDTIIPQEPAEPSPEIDRGRIRTRLLDFNFFRRASAENEEARPTVARSHQPCAMQHVQPSGAHDDPAIFGWLVIVEGPGRGQSFQLNKDVTCLGRGADQDVCLDFGDAYISRTAHVTIHFDRERELVAVRFEDKRNPVHLNGKVLSGTRLLQHKSRLIIGKTILRFVQIDDREAFWST